jgi:hypothetical protein
MPRRRGGLWLPLDVNFMEDDRIVAVGERAAWLYLAMCLASKRLGTDGMLTARQVDRLHVPNWRARLVLLVRVELVADFGDDLWGITRGCVTTIRRSRWRRSGRRTATGKRAPLHPESARSPYRVGT